MEVVAAPGALVVAPPRPLAPVRQMIDGLAGIPGEIREPLWQSSFRMGTTVTKQ